MRAEQCERQTLVQLSLTPRVSVTLERDSFACTFGMATAWETRQEGVQDLMDQFKLHAESKNSDIRRRASKKLSPTR